MNMSLLQLINLCAKQAMEVYPSLEKCRKGHGFPFIWRRAGEKLLVLFLEELRV